MESTLQISEAGKLALRAQWQQLAGNQADDAAASWEKLCELYSEPARHYHNLGHIQALLEWAERFHERFSQYDAVRFAIWFHDAIYNPKQSDNEERSAALAVAELEQLQVPAAMIRAVEQMILATKQHLADSLAEDARWFLDFDLAILGSSPELYRAYSQAIRREYAWVPGVLYRRGRRQVLEGFLQREQLFFTEEMRRRLEARARQNLREELTQLH